MPERIRITSRHDSNEGQDAKVDNYGNLYVKQGNLGAGNKTYEDTLFEAGDSPTTHNLNTDLGRNATDGYIICDGGGDIQVDVSSDGILYGDKATLKKGEILDLIGLSVNKIRITHTGTDSAYRINVI